MMDLKSIVRPNVLALKPYSSARDEYTSKEGIFLDANENPYGTLNRYPDPYQLELKQALAKQKNVEVEEVFLGNGSDEVIDLAFRIFCRPGIDKAITFSPTYGMYHVSAAINDVEMIDVPLDTDFQIDLEQVKPFLKDETCKLIFICSPNNPSGNLIRKEDIQYILQNFRGIVIVDEAYIDFTEGNSMVSGLGQYNNLIVSQTFSKAWGLAAVRIGIAYANKEIIQLYNKVKPPYNISKLNQEAGLKALQNEKETQEYLHLIKEEKARLITAFQTIKSIERIYPSDANFLLLQVSNADKVYQDLLKEGVVTRNRNKQVENCIRVSVGTPQENAALIKALKKVS